MGISIRRVGAVILACALTAPAVGQEPPGPLQSFWEHIEPISEQITAHESLDLFNTNHYDSADEGDWWDVKPTESLRYPYLGDFQVTIEDSGETDSDDLLPTRVGLTYQFDAWEQQWELRHVVLDLHKIDHDDQLQQEALDALSSILGGTLDRQLADLRRRYRDFLHEVGEE